MNIYFESFIRITQPLEYKSIKYRDKISELCKQKGKKIESKKVTNPQGPDKPYDPYQPYLKQKVMRGGSFLCNDAYCSGYRVASRMKSSPDTGLQHTGFRLVKSVNF